MTSQVLLSMIVIGPQEGERKKRVRLKNKKQEQVKNLEERKKSEKEIEPIEEVEEYDFESNFEKQFERMLEEDIDKHLQTNSENFERSAAEDYKRIQEQLKKFIDIKPQSKQDEYDPLEDVSEDYYKKLKGKENMNPFEEKYNQLIDFFTEISQSKTIENEKKPEIKKHILIIKSVIKDWHSQSELIKEQCPREILLKGLLFLMNIEDSQLLLDLCECGIKVFFSLYFTYKQDQQEGVFYYSFNSLVNMIKIMYKLSKEAANDELFRESRALDESINIAKVFSNKNERQMFIKSASKVISGQKNVIVKNDNAAYDLLVYLLGAYKNISIEKANRDSLVNKGILKAMLDLFKGIFKSDDEFKEKLPQCLVQITGTLRNLLSYTGGLLSDILKDIIVVLETYHALHSELALNCLRILSKASLNLEYAVEILKSGCCKFLVKMLDENLNKPFVFVRIAFILGNLTMIFGTAYEEMYNDQKIFDTVHNALVFYLNMWKQKQKGLPLNAKGAENFEKNFNDDVVVKAIRLYANLWISEILGRNNLNKITKEIFESLYEVSSIELNEDNEDLILNGMCCLSNIIYFFPSLPKEFAEKLLKQCEHNFSCDNPDIRVECLRIWANLSRDDSLSASFPSIVNLIFEVLAGINSDKKEIFYSIGTLINLSGDKILKNSLYGPRIAILLNKLEATELEDPELSKNICKVLINLCEKGANWSKEDIDKADKVLEKITEECDEYLDVASVKEKVILNDLHSIANNLINVLPEVSFACQVPGCGRKFESVDKLQEHISRRHNKK